VQVPSIAHRRPVILLKYRTSSRKLFGRRERQR